MHAPSIKMRQQYPRKSEESFGECDMDSGEKVIARSFEGSMWFAFKDKDYIAWRYAGLFGEMTK